MSVVETFTTVVESKNDDHDELDHYFCCDENRGLCGVDLSDAVIVTDDECADCVVCEDLEGLPCCLTCPLRCGENVTRWRDRFRTVVGRWASW